MTEKKEPRMPQYRIIEQALEERIRTGAFSFDEPLCTESTLMAEFASSRITVRRALEELENKGFITRRRGTGCFVSRTAYEAMRKIEAEPAAVIGQSAVYAFLCPDNWKKPMIQAFFDGASEVMDAQDAHAVLYLSGNRPEERPAALLSRFAGMDIAGTAAAVEDANALLAEINHLLLQGKAVVTHGSPVALPHLSGICFDTADAAQKLVGHLAAFGHRRIAYFYDTDLRGTAEHLLALTAHNLPLQSELLCCAADAGALRQCIAAGATAIVAQTEDIVQQLTRELTVLGLHIPGSMSLCCMEDCAPLPALRRGEALRSVTCIHFDYKTLGHELAQRLLQLKNTPVQPAHSVNLPADLRIGTTTAPNKP